MSVYGFGIIYRDEYAIRISTGDRISPVCLTCGGYCYNYNGCDFELNESGCTDMVKIGHASEEMKQIEGYPNYYVTRDGKVWSKKKNDFLVPVEWRRYMQVSLCNNGRIKNHKIHQLVARAFIPNPNNYPIINHKDENPANNHVDNLEWCTIAYNNAYGTKGARTSKAQMNRKDHSKPVMQFTKDGEFVAEYPSCKEAWRQTGISRSHIGDCCNHYRNNYTCGGYRWEWKEKAV